jgi:hypothetical protein
VKINFTANALTADATGNIYGLGLIKSSSERTRSFVTGINPATLDTLWFKDYGLINRDYFNSKSANVNISGKILWASSAKTTQLTKSYLTIPVVTPNSTFSNNFYFGALEDKYYSGEDIHANAIGYGIIGTYYNAQATASNLFFLRTDNQGNYLDGSEKYFDGSLMKGNNDALKDKDNSTSEDSGDAITATADGGFLLAGSMATTPDRGNGGKDILLIRMDAFGNVLWNQVLGGAGDEVVQSIQTDADGNFILCGTSTIAGLSSVYLMKLNSKGELKD